MLQCWRTFLLIGRWPDFPTCAGHRQQSSPSSPVSLGASSRCTCLCAVQGFCRGCLRSECPPPGYGLVHRQIALQRYSGWRERAHPPTLSLSSSLSFFGSEQKMWSFFPTQRDHYGGRRRIEGAAFDSKGVTG
jgi:hypothetical protein